MKKLLSLFLVSALLFTLCACSVNTASLNPYFTFTDDIGNEITLYSKPQRVAVLFSSFAEMWTLAGGNVDITVGESIERGFAKDGVALVDNGAGKTVNTELLIAEKPDFVICSADIAEQVKASELMNSTGTPSACFRVESFEDYLRVLKILTSITGDAEAFRDNGSEVQLGVDAQLARAKNSNEQKCALFIRAGSSPSSVKAKQSDDHFAAAMLSELGVSNIADSAPLLIDSLSIEEIILRNPEYIFISTMGNEDAAKKNVENIFSSSEWQAVTSVKNKKYVFLPKNLFHYKPNAHWDEAYKFLVDFIYDHE